MKIRKMNEIIDDNDQLIGQNKYPKGGSNLETQAHGTTDYNASIGHQPYRYDMLGRFGFTLLPFFEAKEENDTKLIDEIANLLFEKRKEIMKAWYKNPQKFKNEYRKIHNLSFDNVEDKDEYYKSAEKILDLIKPFVESAIGKIKENIGENEFIEGKVLDKKDTKDTEFSKKSKNKDILDKNIKKIADLINKKLTNDDKDKLKKLLEVE